jgi:hypothetical protein
MTTGRLAMAQPSLRLDLSSRRIEPRADTGWYQDNPLTISATLRCPEGGPDCPFPFTFSISANQGARFYFLEENLGSGVPVDCESQVSGNDYTHSGFVTGCIREGAITALTLFAGERKTLRWSVWIQPSGSASLTAEAVWGSLRASEDLTIDPAQVNPVVFLHGILGSMPPGNTVIDRWPQFQGDVPNFSFGPHLDPFVGSYKPLIDNLLRMGYEIDRSIFPVAYDWRQSNVKSAAWLRDMLASRVGANGESVLCTQGVPYVNCEAKADVVVHSMGGLVLRTYIAGLANFGDPSQGGSLDYQNNVDKAVFIATPHRGFPFDYATLHGLTWKDYMDNQVPNEVALGELLLPALDDLLWPHFIMCQYDADAGEPCDQPLVDVFIRDGCPVQALYDYSRANPFDPDHPGIGSIREMIPEKKRRGSIEPRNYLLPPRWGKEENYLLDTLGLNSWTYRSTLRLIGDDPRKFDGIYVLFNDDQSTAFSYDVSPPPPLPTSVPGFPDYTPVHQRWHPGGEVLNPSTNPGNRRDRGDGLIPFWSTRLFYEGGLLGGRLPRGERLADHELRIDGLDHILMMTGQQTQAVVGAILTGLEKPRHVRENPSLFPIHSPYVAPTVILNNTDVFLAVLGCPGQGEAPLETLSIPTDGSRAETSLSYSSENAYRIEVSGTYQWGQCDPFTCPDGGACEYRRFGDAEHLTDDCGASYFDDWFGIDISVYIDGQNVNWGPFRDDHVYSIIVAGRDAPFSFHLNDCAPCYGDNEGSLTVSIFEE